MKNSNRIFIILTVMFFYTTSVFGDIFWKSFLDKEFPSDEYIDTYTKEYYWEKVLETYVKDRNESLFLTECQQERNFVRLLFESSDEARDYRYFYANLDELTSSLSISRSNRFVSKYTLKLDKKTEDKITNLLSNYKYVSFPIEDPIEYVSHAGSMKIEICQNSQPFSMYRRSYISNRDNPTQRDLSVLMMYKFKYIIGHSYEKQKKTAEVIDITKIIQQKIKIEQKKRQEKHALEEKEKKERKEKYHNELLWKATTSGAVVNMFSFKGMNANIKNEKGQTPLMVAVKNGHTRVVDALVQAIVNVKETDSEGRTAFDYIKAPTSREEAMYSRRMYGSLRTLEVLQIVRGKAEVPQYGYKNDTDIVSLIIKGAKCEDFVFPKNTQCSALKKRPIYAAIKFKKNSDFDRLMAEGVDIETKNIQGRTLLRIAVSYKNKYVINRLLESGADMYAMDKYNAYYPFTSAASDGDVEIVKLFLKHGVDVNYQYKKSETALTEAAKGCTNFELVQLLLDNGANPKLMDMYGQNTISGLSRYCRDKNSYKKMMKLIEN